MMGLRGSQLNIGVLVSESTGSRGPRLAMETTISSTVTSTPPSCSVQAPTPSPTPHRRPRLLGWNIFEIRTRSYKEALKINPVLAKMVISH
ncbi:hypothetical protein GUJ93_ZPchr0005g15782 [Zizania palustris]|uniref:Uncharacterized protein n=1 Tax=Zizania palustris TaxID=103762 RepID=A0A8J5STV3_ZIZPA|nr:hypothetical protein GUJ93_ZPchr0005g15782 [Zizania palustris]